MIIRLKSTIDMRTENTSATAAYVTEIDIFFNFWLLFEINSS